MSRSVDERVVSMKFDNDQFEQGVNETMKTLDKFKQKLHFDRCIGWFREYFRNYF